MSQTLSPPCSLLWSGACCACVEYLARQRLSRSQRDAAEHATASPGRRMSAHGPTRVDAGVILPRSAV